MKFLGHEVDIDINEGSTKRGIVMAFFGVAAIVAFFLGMNGEALIGMGMTLCGSMGFALKDNKPQ